ncbi:hypothetical protein ABSA28_00733 [Candidatus Hepatincolaceae symbiont of Richtersius coronifer]
MSTLAKLFIFCLVLIIINTKDLKAEFYISSSAGVSNVDNFALKVNDNISFADTTKVDNPAQPMMGGLANTTTTQTTTYLVTLKNLIFNTKSQYNATASGAIGYRFNNNLRLESEYRYIGFRSKLKGGRVDAKVDVAVDVAVSILGLPPMPQQPQIQPTMEFPLDLEGLLNSSGGNSIIPSNIPINVAFSHGTHLNFFNIIQDIKVNKKLSFFGGAGLGFGFLSFYDMTYPEGVEVTINPWKSKFFAYQFKAGASYNLSKRFDALLVFNSISGLGRSNIGAFTYNTLKFQTIEFGLRYSFKS